MYFFFDNISDMSENIKDIFVKRNENSEFLSKIITNYEETLATVNAIFN